MIRYFILGPIVALLGVMVPNLAQAHTQAYDDGYKTGDTNAINGLAIDTGFLQSHSKNWQAGYWDGWNNAKNNIANSGNTQQSESSSVNIHGSHNTVTVNQGESSQSGNSGSGGSTFRGDQPQCIILCSIIR